MRQFLTDLFAITTAELDEFFEVKEPARASTEMRTDDKQTTIELELPGIKKEDIKIKKITFSNYDKIVISGKTRRGIEFRKGYFIHDSDVENIKAEYKDGILRLVIPKAKKNKEIESEIKIE